MEAKSAALSLNSYLYNQFDNKAVEHDMDDAQEETIPTTTESQLKGQPQSVSDKMLTTVKADISQVSKRKRFVRPQQYKVSNIVMAMI